LIDLRGSIKDADVGIGDLFNGRKSPILAIWYSGFIIIPKGDYIGYGGRPSRFVHTKELYLTVVKGKIVNVEVKMFNRRTANLLNKK